MVGGIVRDEILGLKSKDVDFTCVLSGNEDGWRLHTDPFNVMVDELSIMGFKIFLSTPEYFTVRAQFPRRDISRIPPGMDSFTNLTADFVLARKEGSYDGRWPDSVEMGSLYDDLERRDFTMNAIAKDHTGEMIDPFGGQKDIRKRIIRAVGDPFDRLTEDALRAVRALRFSVTKGFDINKDLEFAMESAAVLNLIVDKISDERIQSELSKMFRYDTVDSLIKLARYPALRDAMFSGTVSLDATMKTKGRGKQ